MCTDCDCDCDIAIDSVEHKMFKCEAVNNERIKYWNKIIAVCPVQLKNEIEKMTLKDSSVFILNGLGNCYIQEWNDVYCAIAMFVHNIFNTGKRNM